MEVVVDAAPQEAKEQRPDMDSNGVEAFFEIRVGGLPDRIDAPSLIQLPCEIDDGLLHRDALPPLLADAVDAIVGAGDLAIDGTDGVGIIAQIDDGQHALVERI